MSGEIEECPTCESRDRSQILSSCRYFGGPHDWHHNVERLTNAELADRLEESNVYDALWCDPVSLVAAEIRVAVRRLRQLHRIEAALGPVSGIRRVGAQLPDATSYSLAALGQWLTGVAEAMEATR